jgi:hypothetical protein
MDLDSMTHVDHARRFALLLASSLGTFVFIALWMALNWNIFLAILGGAAVGTLGFFPFRALMKLFFPPPNHRYRRKVRR